MLFLRDNSCQAFDSKWLRIFGKIIFFVFYTDKFFSVFFDNNIEAYVGIKDCRLMLAQPMDLGTNLFQPRNAHTLIFHNPKRAEFVRRVPILSHLLTWFYNFSSYLSLYPDWPLIKLKKAKRVLVWENLFQFNSNLHKHRQ